MAKALVLVDFEKEWVDNESDYHLGDISGVIDRTNKLIDRCRAQGYSIIFTRHVEPEGGAFAEGKGAELLEELQREEGDVVVTKNKISPFYNTTLERELSGVDEIIIAGILTNLCVRSLVQDAYDRDFDITVVKDCCVAMDAETHEFTLKDLKATREEISLVNAEDLLGA